MAVTDFIWIASCSNEQAVGHQLPEERNGGGRHGRLGLLQEGRDRSERLPRGEGPVADADQAGPHRVERDGQAQAAALPKLDDLTGRLRRAARAAPR